MGMLLRRRKKVEPAVEPVEPTVEKKKTTKSSKSKKDEE